MFITDGDLKFLTDAESKFYGLGNEGKTAEDWVLWFFIKLSFAVNN